VQAAAVALALHNQALPVELIQTHLLVAKELTVNFIHLLLQVVEEEEVVEQQPALQQAVQAEAEAIQGQN